METTTPERIKHKVLQKSKQFTPIVAIAAILLGASFGIQSAYAAFKTPNYKIVVSNPSTTGCTYYDPPTNQKLACIQKNVNGHAETWVKDNRAGAHWAQVYHEMNPTSPGTPSVGFYDTVNGGENCIVFDSYLAGQGFIQKEGKTAENRYGGNVFKFNTSTGQWVFQNWFYAKKSTDGTYTIPANTKVSYTKSTTSGDWTMGSLFESLVDGGLFGGGAHAYAQAYNNSPYYWQSSKLDVNALFCF